MDLAWRDKQNLKLLELVVTLMMKRMMRSRRRKRSATNVSCVHNIAASDVHITHCGHIYMDAQTRTIYWKVFGSLEQ